MCKPQFNLEEKDNASTLKDDFSSRTDPSTFTSIVTVLLHHSNKISSVFQAFKSTRHFLPQSTVSYIILQFVIDFISFLSTNYALSQDPRTPVTCLNPLEPSVDVNITLV